MPDAVLSLERLYHNVNGNQGMHEHIRQMSAAIDRLSADIRRVEGDLATLRAYVKGSRAELPEPRK